MSQTTFYKNRINNNEKSNYRENFEGTKKRKPIEWETLVEKMNHKEKIEYLRVKAHQIEEKAQQKDEMNDVGK